jgi:hypothetical protein
MGDYRSGGRRANRQESARDTRSTPTDARLYIHRPLSTPHHNPRVLSSIAGVPLPALPDLGPFAHSGSRIFLETKPDRGRAEAEGGVDYTPAHMDPITGAVVRLVH